MRKISLSISGFIFFILSASISIHSQAQTTLKYTYDALGRVTFVNDNVNGNRDYDYDKAGNRLLVSTSTATDAAAEPAGGGGGGIPAAPTGLSSSYVADCAYSASWGAVAGITYYNFSDTLGTQTHTTNTSISVTCTRGNPSSNKPKWVQSCNAAGCSAKALF